MENKKQTAVEWLKEQLTPSISLQQKYIDEIFEQAKAMEKEQIIWAYDDAYIAMNLAFRGFDRSVEYYEKTYGN